MFYYFQILNKSLETDYYLTTNIILMNITSCHRGKWESSTMPETAH
jgi:hypothetical protein